MKELSTFVGAVALIIGLFLIITYFFKKCNFSFKNLNVRDEISTVIAIKNKKPSKY